VRNIAVSGDFVITTSQAGPNVWIGNNPDNTTGAYEVPRSIPANPCWEASGFRELAERETGARNMKPSAVSRYFLGKALNFMVTSPGRFLGCTLRKFALFFDNYEVPDNHSFYFIRQHAPVLWALPLPFGVLLTLAVLGIMLTFSRRHLLLYLFISVYPATVILTYVFARYRMPVVGVLIVFAAAGVVGALDRIKIKKTGKLFWPAVVSLAVLAFSCIPAYPSKDKENDVLLRWRNLGLTYLEQERLDEAVRAFERITALRPAIAMGDFYTAMVYFKRKGRFLQQADRHITAAMNKEPDGISRDEIMLLFAEIRATTGRFLSARKAFNILAGRGPDNRKRILRIARRLVDMGNYFAALDALRSMAGKDEESRALLSSVQARMRDADFFRRILENEPDNPWAASFFGLSLVLSGNADEGVAVLEKTRLEHGGFAYALVSLFHAYIHLHRYDDAADLGRVMLEKNIAPYPDDAETLYKAHRR
jgi:tetratricopeptide (TPR) repeat protein